MIDHFSFILHLTTPLTLPLLFYFIYIFFYYLFFSFCSRELLRPLTPLQKLKLANSCWKTSKCWQTRAFTRQTCVKSQHTLNLPHGRRIYVVHWHSRRIATCVLLLFYVNRRRRNRKRWRNRRFGQNRISAEIPPLERATRSSNF